MLTQQRLRELLHYDPNTGKWTWIVQQGNFEEAGYVDNVYGYRTIMIDGKNYRSARLAFLYMTGSFPEQLVDHINRIRCDDRWCNLREASGHQNGANKGIRSDNTSGHIGVRWNKHANKWASKIRKDGKDIHLGYFTDIEEAINARKEAEKNHFKEFAP